MSTSIAVRGLYGESIQMLGQIPLQLKDFVLSVYKILCQLPLQLKDFVKSAHKSPNKMLCQLPF